MGSMDGQCLITLIAGDLMIINEPRLNDGLGLDSMMPESAGLCSGGLSEYPQTTLS